MFRTLALAGVIMGIGKLFRHRAWKLGYGPEGRRLAGHWHQPGGPEHPVFSHWKKWSEKKTEQAASDAEAGTAEAVV
jgi:hypothetical protein